ncbi:50S ribosomal protein L7/L12 [Peptococcaceae bacterium 1198_IL3148]
MDNTIVWIFIIGILLFLVAIISQLKSDISRMNTILNKIAQQVGFPNTIDNELKKLISEGKEVEAVKRYRIATGVGLIEAKKYIDSLNEQDK